MSGRIALLVVLLFGVLLFGLIVLNGSLIALAIPLAIYLAAALFFVPEDLRLSANRSLSLECVSPGRPVVVKLTLTNKGSSIDELLVEDVIPSHLTVVDGTSSAIISLRSGETRQIQYTLSGRRGRFIFDKVQVTACDAFGLHRRRASLPALASLLVLPELKRLRRVSIRPRRTHDYVGPIPARQGGSGVDFFGVREYQVGDPLRWINWKVTARHEQTLYTNEFEQERIADVGLILDARSQSDIHSKEGSLFEYSIQVTASLADAFLSDGNRVGLLIYGRGQEKTFPGYGKVQRERILRALGNARTSDNLALQSLNYLPTRFFPAHSQIVMVSPLSNDDLPVLFQLRALGYSLLIVSPDPVSFEARLYSKDEVVRVATRLANLERVLLLHKLQRGGIQTVDWDVTRSFDQVAYAMLGRLPRGIHAVGPVS
jgi:uncharacterized protein (DUF58 family)